MTILNWMTVQKNVYTVNIFQLNSNTIQKLFSEHVKTHENVF